MEYNSQEREEDLENTKELVAEFEGKMSTKVRRQEKLDMVEEKNFRREELLEKYTAKMLYRWDDRRFENKQLEKNWQRWKEKGSDTSSFRSRNLEGGVILDM